MRSQLDERSYEAKTSHQVVRCNRVHLWKTNEQSLPSSGQVPYEVSVPFLPQSNELPTTVPGEVNLHALSQEDAPLSSPEVVPAAVSTQASANTI